MFLFKSTTITSTGEQHPNGKCTTNHWGGRPTKLNLCNQCLGQYLCAIILCDQAQISIQSKFAVIVFFPLLFEQVIYSFCTHVNHTNKPPVNLIRWIHTHTTKNKTAHSKTRSILMKNQMVLYLGTKKKINTTNSQNTKRRIDFDVEPAELLIFLFAFWIGWN